MAWDSQTDRQLPGTHKILFIHKVKLEESWIEELLEPTINIMAMQFPQRECGRQEVIVLKPCRGLLSGKVGGEGLEEWFCFCVG